MSRDKKRVLAVSVGCPSGIGPEVALRAALSSTLAHRPLLVCDAGLAVDMAGRLSRGAEVALVETRAHALRAPRGAVLVYAKSERLAAPPTPGQPDAAGGRAQLAWVDQAADLVRAGVADALVTGPVSKAAIAASGARGAHRFVGHTEHLAARLGAREVVMAFAAPDLVTSLVTTHLALRDVPRAITPAAVGRACYWTARLLAALGTRGARIAVAALNPHAGEGGMFGDEEQRAIAPGMALARRRLAREQRQSELFGPIGAETAFRKARAGTARAFDAVVAMYHDQATIPSKLLGFGEATNITLGLPIVRTSVDHGTGYDIAGRWCADPRGMIEALAIGARLSASDLARPPSSRTGSSPARRSRR